MSKCSITYWSRIKRDEKGKIVYRTDDKGNPTDVQEIESGSSVIVYENKDRQVTFGLQTFINIVDSEGDEYTIKGEWTKEPKSGKLMKNGNGDDLFVTEKGETFKYHLNEGVIPSVYKTCKQNLLINNEISKN
jgi:hypothetical protein